MKNIFKTIALTAAVVALFASCQHKSEFTTYSYVLAGSSSISVDEDTTAVLAVKAYSQDGIAPVTDVYFEVIEAKGVRGEDYYVEPASGILSFNGEDTEYISILPVPKVAPEGTEVIDTTADYYTGDFTFTIRLKEASNGYTLGGSYTTDVTIVDIEAANAWTSLGLCTFYDSFFFEDTYEVEIFQNDVDPNKFRLEYPYAQGLVAENYVNEGDQFEGDQYLTLTILQPGDVIYDTEVTEEDLVHWEMFDPGFYYAYYGAELYVLHPSEAYDEESEWEHNRVLSYQENELPAQIQLAPIYYMFGVGGWWYEDEDEVVTITFPGVSLGDYSVDIEYAGMFTSAADTTSAVASVTLGEDVDYARVTLVEGRDYSWALDTLKCETEVLDSLCAIGEFAYKEITESGNVAFPVEESGTYTFAVVTFGGTSAEEENYCTFTIIVGGGDEGETWHKYDTGDYEYSLYWSGTDPSLTLYQSDLDDTRFKIEHWGNDVDFVFTWDQRTNDCYVEDQYTGIYNSNYGVDVYVDEFDDWNGGFSYQSYYEGGTFYFCIVYYGAGGYFGYGYESFTLCGTPTSVSDFVGTYSVTEKSYFYYAYYGPWTVEWTFVQSNDSSKGNIMLTTFDDYDCSDNPIYGDLDEETGKFVLYDDQYMGNNNYYGDDFYFTVSSGDYVTFRVTEDGFEGGQDDYFGELYYYEDPDSPEDTDWYWDDCYTDVYGVKVGSGGSSVQKASVRSHELGKFPKNDVTLQKIPDLKRVSVNGTKINAASSNTHPSQKCAKTGKKKHGMSDSNLKTDLILRAESHDKAL